MIMPQRTFMPGVVNSRPRSIGTPEIIEGELPRRALNLVLEWARIHRQELLEDWRLCRENSPPIKIELLA